MPSAGDSQPLLSGIRPRRVRPYPLSELPRLLRVQVELGRALWQHLWGALALAYVLLASVFTAGMVAGGVAYLRLRAPEAGDALALVTADLLDPPAERAVFRTRAAVLIAIYAVGIASDAVAKGAQEKTSAESVTAAMVRSVMACTLWVVAVELVSLLVVYGARGG